MKMKKLKIMFEALDDFIERSKGELELVITERKKIMQKKDEMLWASVEAYQQFMSDQKYAILAAVYTHKPKSVYHLAKILRRAQQNVARDCDLLEGHGFLRYEKSHDRRKTKVPRLSFGYAVIEVHLPRVSYQVRFEDSAA